MQSMKLGPLGHEMPNFQLHKLQTVTKYLVWRITRVALLQFPAQISDNSAAILNMVCDGSSNNVAYWFPATENIDKVFNEA